MSRFRFLWLLALVGFPSILIAQNTAQEVESILDRLERRLMDREGEALDFGEARLINAKHKPKPIKRYRFRKGVTVKANVQEQSHLVELATAVNELEEDIERLANDIQKTKQSVMENAKIDNFVELEATLDNPNKSAIRTLNVKVDGYNVYSLNEASGLWIPSKTIPLFSGPMQPGQHKIELEARLVLREDTGLPVNKDVYRVVNKKFDISIPDGKFEKKWVIALKAPLKKSTTKAEAKLKPVR